MSRRLMVLATAVLGAILAPVESRAQGLPGRVTDLERRAAEAEARLASLRALGAMPVAASQDSSRSRPPAGAPARGTRVGDVLQFTGWLMAAVLLVAACIAFNLMATSALVWAVWALLGAVLGLAGA